MGDFPNDRFPQPHGGATPRQVGNYNQLGLPNRAIWRQNVHPNLDATDPFFNWRFLWSQLERRTQHVAAPQGFPPELGPCWLPRDPPGLVGVGWAGQGSYGSVSRWYYDDDIHSDNSKIVYLARVWWSVSFEYQAFEAARVEQGFPPHSAWIGEKPPAPMPFMVPGQFHAHLLAGAAPGGGASDGLTGSHGCNRSSCSNPSHFLDLEPLRANESRRSCGPDRCNHRVRCLINGPDYVENNNWFLTGAGLVARFVLLLVFLCV